MIRRIFVVTLSSFAALFLATPSVRCWATPPQDAFDVLFIGNSLTFYNDLPKMVAELAKADKQATLMHDRETPGGCSFEKHWKDGKALAKIQSRKWDYVILQGYSAEPITKRASMFEHAKKLDAVIRKKGARSILYMTWALENKPEDQAKITKAYADLAAELKCTIAPVGIAWEMALQQEKRPSLHTKDKKHPTPTGTYLAACVIYATIYNRNPEGLPGSIGKLTDSEARPLQAIAWRAVQSGRK